MLFLFGLVIKYMINLKRENDMKKLARMLLVLANLNIKISVSPRRMKEFLNNREKDVI